MPNVLAMLLDAPSHEDIIKAVREADPDAAWTAIKQAGDGIAALGLRTGHNPPGYCSMSVYAPGRSPAASFPDFYPGPTTNLAVSRTPVTDRVLEALFDRYGGYVLADQDAGWTFRRRKFDEPAPSDALRLQAAAADAVSAVVAAFRTHGYDTDTRELKETLGRFLRDSAATREKETAAYRDMLGPTWPM